MNLPNYFFIAQCYCGWKFSCANSENLLKWLKILFTAIQQMERDTTPTN